MKRGTSLLSQTRILGSSSLTAIFVVMLVRHVTFLDTMLKRNTDVTFSSIPTKESSARQGGGGGEGRLNEGVGVEATTTTSSTGNNVARHFLDCDKINSTCRTFYPVDFWERPTSVGYPFRDMAIRELYGEEESNDRWLPANYLRFTHPEKIRQQSRYRQDNPNVALDQLTSSSSSSYPPPDFTYLHVRKVGGITLKFFGYQFQQRDIGQGYTMDIKFTAKMDQLLSRYGTAAVIAHLQALARETFYFTFVRNPVSRFLSAMGQLVTKRPESLRLLNCTAYDNNNNEFVDRNVALIQCVLRALKAGTSRVDEHFTAATVELYQPLHHVNASVAVMPVDRLGDFMQSLQVKNFVVNSKKQQQFQVAILDDDMVHDICQVYAVDVHMLRLLGMTNLTSDCDAHVPWGSYQ